MKLPDDKKATIIWDDKLSKYSVRGAQLIDMLPINPPPPHYSEWPVALCHRLSFTLAIDSNLITLCAFVFLTIILLHTKNMRDSCYFS